MNGHTSAFLKLKAQSSKLKADKRREKYCKPRRVYSTFERIACGFGFREKVGGFDSGLRKNVAEMASKRWKRN